MRARAELSVAAGDRLGRVVSAPPICFRAAGDAVYLVGTAAGPLGDDDISVRIDLAPGATLRLRSAAATVVYAGEGSQQRFDVSVGPGAVLDWRPEPLIATSGCHHHHHARVTVSEDATLDWTEEVILGRHGEASGVIELRLDVDLEGKPLLRHQLVIGAPGWDGPAVLGAHRATGLRLVAGPGMGPPSSLGGDGWGWFELDAQGWLLVAVAGDLPELRARMAEASSFSGS